MKTLLCKQWANRWKTQIYQSEMFKYLEKFRVSGFAQGIHKALNFLGVLLAGYEQCISSVDDDYVLESNKCNEPAGVANQDAAGGIG